MRERFHGLLSLSRLLMFQTVIIDEFIDLFEVLTRDRW